MRSASTRGVRRGIVTDPDTARALTPTYPFMCKRPIIDQGYYQTFNRENVTLVDLRTDPIVSVRPGMIETGRGLHEFDVIVYATGFDGMTGALRCIDVRGRAGSSLGEFWATEGPLSYLGMADHPRSRKPLGGSDFRRRDGAERGMDRCLYRAPARAGLPDDRGTVRRATGLDRPGHRAGGAHRVVHPSCHSWYNGGNVPGKKRMYMGYTAGIPEYRRRCDGIAADGYTGFKLA